MFRPRRTALAVAAILLASGVSSAEAAGSSSGTSRTAVLADQRNPWGYAPGTSGGYGAPEGYGGSGTPGYGGSSGSSSATSTVVSTAATAAQATGVVLIDTTLPYQNAEAAGTGMVLTSSGQVLTNYHVVEGAGTISVTVASSGETYAATVVGSDQTDDVALLQLTGASGLSTVAVDDDATTVGQSVTAVGNAGGTGTLTAASGTISSLTSSVTAGSESSGSPTDTETLSSMIQTTADVVAGDSGGPLLDTEGEVIGIDTAASTGSVIDGYAIPIARALSIVEQIRSGTATSTVRVGAAAFLGVELSTSSTSAYGSFGEDGAYGVPTSQGATIAEAVDGGAAQTAGLAAGDVITAVGGTPVTSASGLTAALSTKRPGDQVSLTWTDTEGQQHTATVTLGASPVA